MDAAIALKINPAHFGKGENVRQRKNAGLVRKVLQQIKDAGVVKAGEAFDTSALAKVIRENGLERFWDLSPDPKDAHGLERTLGDVVGGHGLNLERASARRFRMPDELPEMNGDSVVKEAVYKHVLPADGKTKPYTAAIEFKGGVFKTWLKFGEKIYANFSSDPEAVLNILNPIACDWESEPIEKRSLRMIIEASKKNVQTLFLIPSMYQKLYGAHSPGRTTFQLINTETK